MAERKRLSDPDIIKSLAKCRDAKYSNNMRLWLQMIRKRSVHPQVNVYVYKSRRTKQHPRVRYILTAHEPPKIRGDSYAHGGYYLDAILTTGGRAVKVWMDRPGGQWVPVKRFWKNYLALGICALDPQHEHYPDRWVRGTNKRLRTCRFCKQVQRLKKVRHTVTIDHWENA